MIVQLSLNAELSRHFEYIPEKLLSDVLSDLVVAGFSSKVNPTKEEQVKFDNVSMIAELLRQQLSPATTTSDSSNVENLVEFKQMYEENTQVMFESDELDDDLLALMQ